MQSNLLKYFYETIDTRSFKFFDKIHFIKVSKREFKKKIKQKISEFK